MKPRQLTRIIGGKRFSTETATLLSGNDWFDGHNFERQGRQTYLYRSPAGAYFCAELSSVQGEDRIILLSDSEALEMYSIHAEHGKERVPLDEAFPGVEIAEG